MEAVFTKFEKGENWVHGECGDYVFCSKLFDEGSAFGINDGRVSKLSIKHKDSNWGNLIVNYDRGWDVEPENEASNIVYNEVMKLLENAPTDRFVTHD